MPIMRFGVHWNPVVLPPIAVIKQEIAPVTPTGASLLWLQKQPVECRQQNVLQSLANAHQQFLWQKGQLYNIFLKNMGEWALPGGVASNISGFPGPKFSRSDLEGLASGEISRYFGEWFAPLDHYPRLIRMPEPPLLLADRVLGIDAIPGSMQSGIIWTETDVTEDAWYLHQGHMPVGIMIEAGQADLLLASWLGFDAVNRGERIYRLLGCELSFYGELPQPGDTLHYDIHIHDQSKQGDITIFFFYYDCHVNGELRLKVRNGQAGFFSDQELAEAGGVLWDAAAVEVDAAIPCAQPLVDCQYDAFSSAQLKSFSEGCVMDCFGVGFELTLSHTRTPRIAAGKMLLIEEITHFDVHGGPLARGYMRATQNIHPDDWFFQGHFKNDPCMPGTLMTEAGLQLMACYLTAVGCTLQRDGWRFEPAKDQTTKLRCRGQVTPQSKQVVYEIFVYALQIEPIPQLQADLLGSCDGLKIFHGRFSLSLIPDWPLSERDLAQYRDIKPVASTADGFNFGYAALLACALGKPAAAFGPIAEQIPAYCWIPHLPAPPYHFMSRMKTIQTEPGNFKAGDFVECEYDIVGDMPFCVLLEAGLQPCGWFATFSCMPFLQQEKLLFRNLDGTGILHVPVLPVGNVLSTKVICIGVSHSAGMIILSFKVSCYIDELLVYEMDTTFGFFPVVAFLNQVGISSDEIERDFIEKPSTFYCDLTIKPQRYFSGSLHLPSSRFLMLDRITGLWNKPGELNLGYIRAEKTVRAEEWFFKAHFFQDPVQPGSLGVEAMIQLLQFYILEKNLHEGIDDPEFLSLALEEPLTWKYRGQVIPTNQCISLFMEVTSVDRKAQALLVKASASLWVDGKKIYTAKNLGMSVISTAKAKTFSAYSERVHLDPVLEPWVCDHCPNFLTPILPMMNIIDYMATAAVKCFPGLKLLKLEDVILLSWIAVDEVVTMDVDIVKQDDCNALATLFLVKKDKRTSVAHARCRFGIEYPPQPMLPSPLVEGHLVDNVYDHLIHGPAFQLTTQLLRNQCSASSTLDTLSSTVPNGTLYPGVLDAALHGIPHSDLNLWSDAIGSDWVAFPHKIISFEILSADTPDGLVQSEVKFLGFHDNIQKYPLFEVVLIIKQKVWIKMLLVEILLPKGPFKNASVQDMRNFIVNKKPLAHIRFSEVDEEGQYSIKIKNIRLLDWSPGFVEKLYGVSRDLEIMPKQILIKEFLAMQLNIHPSEIEVENVEYAYAKKEPAVKYRFDIEQRGEAYFLKGIL